jgi:hypothetical protein
VKILRPVACAAFAALLSPELVAQVNHVALSQWQPDLRGPADFLAGMSADRAVPAGRFGARPGDLKPDSAAIEEALRFASTHGNAAVVLEPGEYRLDRTVHLFSGVALVGGGCGTTTLVRAPNFNGQALLEMRGVSNLRIQGLSFDHNSGPPFTVSVALRGPPSHDVVILDSCFTDSHPLLTGGDRWAVSLGSGTGSPSERVWIGRNSATGRLQLTANGGQGVHVLRIVDNVVRGGRNAGIAVSTLHPQGSFNDVLVAGNRIFDSHGIGIYIGPDRETAVDSDFRNIAIRRNIISGFTGDYPIGIYLRAGGRRMANVTVSANEHDGQGRRESTAIRFTDKFWKLKARIEQVTIADNSATGFERGIWLSSVDDAALQRNRVRTINGMRPYIVESDQNGKTLVEPGK